MATLKKTLLMILLAMIVSAITARDIPEFLHICNTRDPQYVSCIGKSLETLKPYLKIGIPEFNIPAMEPLKLEQLTFNLNTIQIHTTDIIVKGASNFIVRRVKADFDRLFFMVDVKIPYMSIEAKYDINGKLLFLPLHGSGPFHGNFTDCTGIAKFQDEKYMDNGVEKIRIKDFKLKFSVDKAVIKLDNLFDGGKAIGDVINKTINDNFHLFLSELMPVMEETLSKMFQMISDNILKEFSYDELFPST